MASDQQLNQAHILAQMAHIHAATQQQQQQQREQSLGAGPSTSNGGSGGGFINTAMSGLAPPRTVSGGSAAGPGQGPGAGPGGLKRQRSSFHSNGAGGSQRIFPGDGSGRDASELLSDEPEGEGDYSDESEDEDDEDGEDGDGQGEDGAEGKRPNAKGRGRATSGVTTDGQGEPPLGYLPDGSIRKKPKLTRGSRACTVCRRLKMKCVGADLENNGPCKRCRQGGFDCIFEESNRGKKTNRSRKSEAMAQSLKKMEQTLDTVLRSIHNPGYTPKTSGMANSPPASAPLTASPVKPISTPPLVLSRNPTQQSHPPIARTTTPFATSSARLSDLPMDISHIRNPIHTPVVTGDGSSTLIKLLETAQSQEAGGKTPALGAELRLPGEETSNQPSRSPSGQGPSRGVPYGGRGRQGTRTGSENKALKRSPSSNVPLSPRLHSLPDNSLNPLGLLAEASLQNSHRKKLASTDGRGSQTKGKGKEDAGEEGVGIGNEHYFKPGPMSILPLRRVFIEREVQPEVLNILTAEQVSDLFDLYFDKMHRHVPVLDREFHTPSLVCSRSPFLLTAICTIAARFYKKAPDLYPRLSVYAKKLMFDVPSKGYKSVEVVQAYLLFTCWCLGPEERFEQDRTWLLLGLAIRTATDLNLQRKSVITTADTEENRAREKEIVNRERCWLHCFVLDRSFSAQLGKPWTIREDYIIRNCHRDSWLSQRHSQDSDLPLSAYVNLQQIMSRALDTLYSSTTTASGLMTQCDYPLVLRSVQEQLDLWVNEWISAFIYQPYTEELKRTYTAAGHFYYSYSCLSINSFGLQNALEHSPVDLAFFFGKVYHAAITCLDITEHEFAKHDWLQYLPDSQFVMISYAVLSLLKLIRPEFRSLHANQQAILTRVSAVADLLARTAVDSTHTPALYAVLLRSLISAKAEELKTDSKNVVLANGIMSRPSSPTASMFDSAQMQAMHQHGMGPGGMGMGPGDARFMENGAISANALWNHGLPASAYPESQSPARIALAAAANRMSRQQEGQGPDGANGQQRNGPGGEPNNGGYLSYQVGMLMDPTMAISVPDGGGNTFGLSGPQPVTTVPPSAAAAQRIHTMATSAPSAAPTPMTPWAVPPLPQNASGAGPGGPSASGLGTTPHQTPHGTPHGQGMPGQPGVPGGYDDYGALLGMDGFGAWDSSLLMPGFGLGQLELSGGLVHGQWGSGFISPNMGMTPSQSRQASPRPG